MLVLYGVRVILLNYNYVLIKVILKFYSIEVSFFIFVNYVRSFCYFFLYVVRVFCIWVLRVF